MGFVTGKFNQVTIVPQGYSSKVLRILEWSWAEKIERLLTTHSLSNGLADCLPGILDGEGSVMANIWAAEPPDAIGVLAGNFAMITKQYISVAYGTPRSLSIPILITEVPYKSAVGALVNYEMRVALASGYGTYNRAA